MNQTLRDIILFAMGETGTWDFGGINRVTGTRTAPTMGQVVDHITKAVETHIAEFEEALRPFANLSAAMDDPYSPDTKAMKDGTVKKTKDDAIYCGQVIRAVTDYEVYAWYDAPIWEDRHHPVTFGDLRRAKAVIS